MNVGGRQRDVTILLVEDNPDHAELALRALQNGGGAGRIVWVRDGEEALDFLYRRRRYAGGEAAPRPGLVLLDLKLPRVDGHEVLRRVKHDPDLRTIPVVMLTTSDRDDHIVASYAAGANSFITKPVRFPEFVDRLTSIARYWLQVSRLPEP